MGILVRSAFTIGAVVLFAGCGGSQTPTIAPGVSNDNVDALPYHKTFKYTGSEQSFKVPSGVKAITVVALGAAGSAAGSGPGADQPGDGGRVYAVVPVRSGETLYVFVGGEGTRNTGGAGGGGFNGGGAGYCCYDSGGGGGASDVRESGDSLTDRILVAAGGGGQGSGTHGYGWETGDAYGGNGGGTIGQAGGHGSYGSSGPSGGTGGGGGGGTQRRGGKGGTGEHGGRCDTGRRGKPGTLGIGGRGGRSPECRYAGGSGGGGGGGYYGGGGGGGGDIFESGGGGGGGSSYVESNAIKSRLWRGWKTATGNGLVVFSWQ